SAGLETSTVTPGSTPPEVSLTTPAIVACAIATTGSNTRPAMAKTRVRTVLPTHSSPNPHIRQRWGKRNGAGSAGVRPGTDTADAQTLRRQQDPVKHTHACRRHVVRHGLSRRTPCYERAY